MSRTVLSLLWVFALAAVCRADGSVDPGAPWAGEWRVEGSERTRHLHVVDGHLALDFDLGGLAILLEGSGDDGVLSLQAERASHRGAAGALAGLDDDRPPARVTLVATQREDPDDGRVRAEATFVLSGEGEGEGQVRTLREVWVRYGAPRLEVVSRTPAGVYDPKHTEEPLKLVFRVIGRPQAVRLRVHIASGVHSEAADFYRGQGLEDWIYQAPVGDGGLLDPGEYEVTWSGRDQSPAERIALGGSYELELCSVAALGGYRGPGLPRVTERVFVNPPWYTLIGPRSPGRDRSPGFLAAVPNLSPVGFDVRPRIDGWHGDHRALPTALRQSAAVSWSSHGWTSLVAYYEASPDGTNVRGRGLSAATLRRRLSAGQEPRASKPLGDLHMAFLWGCRVGARDRETGREDLSAALVEMGADVVVSFTASVLAREHTPWQERLTAGLRAGIPVGGASRLAADEADLHVWDRMSASRQRTLRRRDGLAPLRESLRVHTADGIDGETERLVPARYGNSTN